MSAKKLIGLLCVILFLGACSKYEEGPKFSLRPKSSRLQGGYGDYWELEKITVNGTERTIRGDDIVKYEFDKISGTGGEYKFKNDESGKFSWKFYGDVQLMIKYCKDEMIWGYGLQTTCTDWIKYEIVRLSNKELWLKRKDYPGSGDYTMFYFNKKHSD